LRPDQSSKPRRLYSTWLADSRRWDGFVFREGDIVIATPAKCGTTWMQMICALLVLGTDPPAPLTELSPWLDIRTAPVAAVHAALAAQPHRRFIKTHTPLDGLPFDDRVTYICVGRDPRDAAISAAHHLAAMDRDVLARAAAATPPPATDPAGAFWHWVEAAAPPEEGLALTLHHLSTFWTRRTEPNVVLVHYDDLRAGLEPQMRSLAARLGLTPAESAWPGLVAAAGFDRMRAGAARLAPQATLPGLWPDATRFFHRGTSGQWRDRLGPADLERYWTRVHDLAAPDLTTWLHGGPPPIGPSPASAPRRAGPSPRPWR
jgi:hypothetical protein